MKNGTSWRNAVALMLLMLYELCSYSEVKLDDGDRFCCVVGIWDDAVNRI